MKVFCSDCPAPHQCAEENECCMEGYISARREAVADLVKNGMPEALAIRCARSIERQSRE